MKLEYRANMYDNDGSEGVEFTQNDYAEFDELVVTAGAKLVVHIEMMNETEYYVRVGDEPCMWVSVDKDGKITVNHDV